MLQAARDAGHLAAWTEEQPSALAPGIEDEDDEDEDEDEDRYHRHRPRYQEHRSTTVMALGNSCFGSLEYPRELPPRVHMVSGADFRFFPKSILVCSNFISFRRPFMG